MRYGIRIRHHRETLGLLSVRLFRYARRAFIGVCGPYCRTFGIGSGRGYESPLFGFVEPYRRFGTRTRPKNWTLAEFRRKNRYRRDSEPLVQSDRRVRIIRVRSLFRYRSRRALSPSNGRKFSMRREIDGRVGRSFQARKRVDLQRPVRRIRRNVLRELPRNGKFERIRGTAGSERRRLVVSDRLLHDHVSERRRILLLLQLLTAPI